MNSIGEEGTIRRWQHPLAVAAIVFIIAAFAAAGLVKRLERYRLQQARLHVSNSAADHAFTLQRHLEQAFSATYALAALVRQGNGKIANFEAMASQLLPFYPGVAALELVPDGIVQSVVPLAGNESALGHNLLQDPVRNKEAFLARDTGRLTLAGPFELIQGGLGAVARLPVFLEDRKGARYFWGFTAVLIRFPETMAPARLAQLAEEGLRYQLWRIHPDTGKKQIICSSTSAPLMDPVEQQLELPNGRWTLSVAPVDGWSDTPGLTLQAAVGLLLSLLLAWLAKLLVESKVQEARLEALVAERTAEYRESEERLRLLGDNLPNSYIYQIQFEGTTPRFLHLSAGVEKLHGVSREDVLRDGGILYRQIDPEHAHLLVEAEAASEVNMSDFHIELRIRLPEGDLRWLQLRSRPRLRPDGRVFWDGVATDITEEKNVEEALRQERDLSDALLNALPGLFYLFDDRLSFLRWNRNVEKVTGYTGDEISRMTPLDFFSDEDRMLVAKRIQDAFEQGVTEVEAQLVLKDGTSRPFYFTAVRHRIAGKVCLVGVGIDITARKMVEEALEAARVTAVQEKGYVEGIMEALPVGVAISNLQGEYVRINPTFQEIWIGSAAPPPFLNEHSHYRAWFMETGESLKPEEWASARALRWGEKTVGQLLKIERWDGTKAFIHNSAAPLHDAEGRIAGCAVAVMDITEQMEIKESLRSAKNAAEAANSAKTQFLANMSHELRTPMTAMLGMLQLALEEELAPSTRGFLESILTSARLLLRILNDILDMTSIAAGKLGVVEKTFSLRRCVSEAFDMFALEARRKQLEMTLRVDAGVPDAVVGDQVRLRQVLINLIGNAVKFTGKGGVEVGVIAGGMTAGGERIVTFSVTDTGVGIPENKKGLLFAAFSQVDTSYSRRFGGTGLGLAISKEIVALLGGEISFESREGEGSTFSFSVPLAVASTGDAVSAGEGGLSPMALPGSAMGNAPRLLLAEDDPTIRQLFSEILRKVNYHLDTAEDGLEAVEMWEKGDYDLVLMDIQMPRMDGIEATTLIREKERARGGHTAIVAVTAHAFTQDEERCLAAGMDAYISKPIEFRKVFQVIRQLVKKREEGA